MRGAIVSSLRCVFEPGNVLRHELLKKTLKISPRRRISILHQDQTAAGVADKDGRNSNLDSAPRNFDRNLSCNLVGPLAFS